MICKGCNQPRDREDFSNATRRKDGREFYCRSCVSRQNRRQRLSRYGLTPEGYEELLALQGGVCAICGTDQPGGHGPSWQVDHNHACCASENTCGQCRRGLLCLRCNVDLGRYEAAVNNPALLAYVEKHA